MKDFNIVLFDDAISDMQNGLEYYKNISPAIAKKFYTAVKNTFAELKTNPFYQVRYDNVRMRQVKGFPHLLHFGNYSAPSNTSHELHQFSLIANNISVNS